MSGSKIAIAITAVDGASAKLEGINKRIAAMGAPVAKLQKSFARFGDASGITKLSKGFGDLSRGSLDAFRNIARVVDPLAAITGAASLAGMVKLTQSWANFGSQLGFAAQRLGMSAGTLQTFQGGAMLAGASASSLTSGIQTLRDGLWNAAGGRNPALVATMAYMGFSMGDVTKAAHNLTAYLPQFADKIAAIKDPSAQAAVATALFGGAAEDLLPWLRQGSKVMAEYNAMAVRYGVINAAGTTAANNLRMAQVGLSLAVQGLGNSIAQNLAPILDPVINQMSEWIAANRVWIAQKVGVEVGKFIAWLKSINWNQVGAGIAGVGAAIGAAVKALGGWAPAARDVLLFVGGAWLAGMLAPIASIAAALAGVTATFVGLPVLAGAAALAAVVALHPSQTGTDPNGGTYNGKYYTPPTATGMVVPGPTGRWVDAVKGGMRGHFEAAPRGATDNNPLNYTGKNMGGETGMDGPFGKYNNPTNGVAGGVYQILRDQNVHGDLSLRQKTSGAWKWNASPDPGGNYLKGLLSTLGLKPSDADKPYDINDPKKMAAYVRALSIEEGTSAYLSGSVLSAGVAQGMGIAPTPAAKPVTNIANTTHDGPTTNIAYHTHGGHVTSISYAAPDGPTTNIAYHTHRGHVTNIANTTHGGPTTNIANTQPAGPITNIVNTQPAGPAANIGDGGTVPAAGAAANGDADPAAGVSPGLAKVLIEVQHLNVPRGVTMKATTNSPAATIGRLKIVRAMEGHA